MTAIIEHVTTADTLPREGGPGGTWSVSCTCGWAKTGDYARTNGIAEAVALRVANAYGQQHEQEIAYGQEAGR